jgi:hypothetical protein
VSDDKYVDELSQAAQRAGNIVTEHVDSIIADAKRRADQIREDAERDAELTKREAMDSASRVFQSIQTLERPLGELVETLRFEMDRVGRELDGQVGSHNGPAIESTATDDDSVDDTEGETARPETEVDGGSDEESVAADSEVELDEESPAADSEVALDAESLDAESDGEPDAESLATDSGVAPEPAADSDVAASEPDPEAAPPAEPDPESWSPPEDSDPAPELEAEEPPPGEEPRLVAESDQPAESDTAAESDTPAEADPAAQPEWHSPPAAAATSSPGKAKRWLTSRFGGDGETKGVFISSQGHCAVCQKTFMAGSREALDLSGWRVNGDVGLCPECQSNGWQLPQDATLPYRRGGGG